MGRSIDCESRAFVNVGVNLAFGGRDVVSWLDSFSVKSKSAVFQESKSFFNMFTKYNIWFTESTLFSLSESQRDFVALLGLQKHL